jgi:site-specific recombinase XerD
VKPQNTNDLPQAVDAYLRWMASAQYSQHTIEYYQWILKHCVEFANGSNMAPIDLFTCEALKAFESALQLKSVRLSPVRGLARYLYENNQLEAPMKKHPEVLPDIYEEYLAHYEDTRNVDHTTIRRCRNVFIGFHRYLDDDDLSKLTIDQIDAFLKDYNAGYSPASQRHHRSCVRGFLQHLYYQKKIFRRDLSTLLASPPFYAQAKPPRFLRPEEVERLFSSLRWNRPRDFRDNAMIYLAYTLGLRPKEISLISLDDIAFAKEEIILPNRKNTTPLRLPLPEEALKAIVAYMAHARPQTDHRALFVNLTAPYRPVFHYTVSYDISNCLHKAGISESAYCLRHTYAQNLLETGASIFQVKEMLGHDRIQTTRRYIHVHTRLMRKRLFDETF